MTGLDAVGKTTIFYYNGFFDQAHKNIYQSYSGMEKGYTD